MTARVDPRLVREAWRRFGPLPADHELIVDLFAGGGGASLGIEQALGRSPDVAINHDPEAVAMHAANHPATWHLISDVWEVAPEAVTAGRPVGLLWASPDCKHFSKAKGGQPVKKRIRALAWIVVKWARAVSPRVIILENVEEFATWGPLVQKTDANGVKLIDLHGSPVMVPCKARRGQTFHRWRRQLERLGYRVEWRERRAYGSGAGTIRKRLYLIARRDGRPIVWPAATHGDPKKHPDLKPWVTAADKIDWSLPCPSIFETAAEIKARFGIRAIRPLRPKTCARIAKGTSRYVIKCESPFIVPITHGGGEGRAYSAHDPLNTLTGAKRGELALVQPFVTKFRNGATGQPVTEPLATITAHQSVIHPGGNAPLGVVTPFLVPRYGERTTQAPRALAADQPMPVIVPTGNGAALVAPHLMTMRNAEKPHETADRPAHTVTAGGANPVLVSAFIAKHYGDTGQRPGSRCAEPLDTITAQDHHAVVAAHVLNLRGSDRRDAASDRPLNTVSAGGNHAAAVLGFLAKYYGAGSPSQPVDQPEHTVTAKPRMALVEVLAAALPFGPEHYARARQVAAFLRAHGYWDDREFVTIEVEGIELVLVDIGMRMLTPRERFGAQGFPDSTIIDLMVPKDRPAAKRLGTWERVLASPDIEWKRISAEAQGRMVGNSVCPTEACALAGANCGDLAVMPEAASA